MPLQNRVTPAGEIIADPARGTFMGNRGILHDDRRRLGRSRWKHKAWIICRIAFRGRHRQVMTPRRYTELFFLDEAVAIAAGHRPCYECRRAAYEAWRVAWSRATGNSAQPSAPEMDARLHRERVDRKTRTARLWSTPFDDLPAGAFVLLGGQAHLVCDELLLPWSPVGYDTAIARPTGTARVLTPLTACRVLAAGYLPEIHASAQTPIYDGSHK
jgi:hypothetical protein